MALELASKHRVARETFEEADRVLGFSLSGLCFGGPAEDLDLTENTQPALVAASVAAWRVLDELGVTPSVVAGLSLGEYAALVAAGSLDLADAVSLVRRRARYQQECVPPGQGAMAAIIGLEPDLVAQLCAETTTQDSVVEAANFNGPGQVVVSGHTAAVKRACERALLLGARKAVQLRVSAPFHCSLLEEAGVRLRADLERTEIRPARVPMLANVSAQPVCSPREIVDALVAGVSAPVLWDQCIKRMAAMGVDSWVEVGPGVALSGMVKRILPDVTPLPAGTPECIDDIVNLAERVS